MGLEEPDAEPSPAPDQPPVTDLSPGSDPSRATPLWFFGFLTAGIILGVLALSFGFAASKPKGFILATMGIIILAGDLFLFLFRRRWND